MSEQDRQWQLLRQGEQEALGYLFKYYYEDLYQYALTMLGQHAAAQDHLQQCFLKLWDRHATLPPVVKVKSYLFQSLRFGIIDQLRSEKTTRKKLLDFLSLNQVKANLSDDRVSSQREQLNDALQTLSPTQKEIIYLRFYNQVPYTEIAEITGMQYQSVRNAAHRAIKKLRLQLRPKK